MLLIRRIQFFRYRDEPRRNGSQILREFIKAASEDLWVSFTHSLKGRSGAVFSYCSVIYEHGIGFLKWQRYLDHAVVPLADVWYSQIQKLFLVRRVAL